jgi:hypothetical protein
MQIIRHLADLAKKRQKSAKVYSETSHLPTAL